MSALQIIASSQNSVSSHRKLCNKLFALRLQEAFLQDVFQSINIILTIKKGNSNADRVLRFIVTFINYLQQKDPKTDIAQPVLKHALRGLDAKDKTVRFRSCQVVARVINCVKEIDDDIYSILREKLLDRVVDRESFVRLEAVIALSRLQEDTEDEENDVRNMLLFLLQNDPSPDVRRAVLLNIEVSKVTLPFILERARDVDATNRKCVYSKVLPKIGDFRYLSIKKRVRILKWGMNDRDDSVQQAASNMLAYQWIESADNNLLELLERLDVVQNSEVANLAIKCFFTTRLETLTEIEFPDQFWLELTAESALLARSFSEVCAEKNFGELAEKIPEVSQLTYFIEKQYVALRDRSTYEEASFIIEQLLLIALNQDMADEIGRRKLLKSLTNSLSTSLLSETLISLHVELLKKLCSTETDFCSLLVEIITDIFEQGHAETAKESELQQAPPKSPQEKEPEAASSPVPSNMEEDEANEETEEYKEAFSELRCLSYVQALFENISSPLNENLYVIDLLKSLIIPAVKSHDLPIREKGLECLSLVCLLNSDLAYENVPLYLHCLEKGTDNLKIIALRTLTDIFLQHGKDRFSTYDEQFSSLLLETLFNIDEAELQTLSAEAIAKLLVIVHYRDELFLKPLIIQYFEPNTVENFALRQVLGYFFPVYVYGSPENQWKVAEVFCDTLLNLMEVYRDIDEDDLQLSTSQISLQMLDWTDNEKLFEKKVNSESYTLNNKIHLHLANNIFECLPRAPEGKDRKLMVSLLGKLNIPDTLPSDDFSKSIRKLQTFENHGLTLDSTSMNILKKFETTLRNNEAAALEREEQEAKSDAEHPEVDESKESENKEEEPLAYNDLNSETTNQDHSMTVDSDEEVYVKEEED
ncbi:condensin complex non-SMC subunit Cnd3 [Schizosaccharomyces cryophilus OY26]|uniref:Condensin complex non-SMC subunit Cnd3 n=1 Tax=Schizosaccharomyces cryophilus (strain OY26 / ATCC MYA-4695 / CBS 11777 / NBRC 106824 / NRRL Y48691) TaxID=653667 RepID=S9X2J3_SCHCR|nr:condensin complex non-SMC subunit Cnd3 [Schizosaccharomyces cryophilus OY26]EPY51307.1 condensin complex non-SMC subunit Cnd3 [Schizosaccharomyces cryophilus OY26]